MYTHESDGETDYIYYPIEYTTNVFSTLLTINRFPKYENWICWLISIDKSKFIDGISKDKNADPGQPIVFNLISVGF